MGFVRKVPSTSAELNEYLKKVHESANHVNSVKVNTSNSHLEIDLDWLANRAGHPDMYMPIKKGKMNQAVELVERMMRQSKAGFAPSTSDGEALFDMIDQQG